MRIIRSGTLDVSGIVSGVVVVGTGELVVESRGTAISSLVSAGGEDQVFGIASGTVVGGQGLEDVGAGGRAGGTVLSSGGFQIVEAGGSADGTVVESGAGAIVSAGGTVADMTVESGASITIVLSSALGSWNASGSNIVEGATIASGALVDLEVASGGSVAGFAVVSGAVLIVDSGGAASSALVGAGGSAVVASGGVASGTVVSSGGAIALQLSSAVASWNAAGANTVDGVTIDSGANLSLSIAAGGSTAGLALSGILLVSAGGEAAATADSGAIFVFSGGATSGTVVASGGFEAISSGGSASGTVVDSGGLEIVSFGGSASGLVVESGGDLAVLSGGSASGTVVSAGGFAFLDLSSALGLWNVAGSNVVDGVTLQSGATTDLFVDSSGSVSGFLAVSGGFEEVGSAGSASGMIAGSGGVVQVDPGGTAIGTVVSSGGELLIISESLVSGTVFDSGGIIELVGLHGIAAHWSNNVLRVTLAGGRIFDVSLPGDFAGEHFVLSGDGEGDTNISLRPGTPIVAAPASAIVAVGAPVAISGVSLSEAAPASGETFTVRLTDRHGGLAASGGGISGSGTTSLTIAGSLSEVNADLATLTDEGAARGKDRLTIAASDSSGGTSANRKVAVTVNGLPVISAPHTARVTLGKAGRIVGVRLTEGGNTAGETFTVTLADGSGVLSVSGGGLSASGTSIVISGSLSVVNAALKTLKDAAAAADTITVNATDSFGNPASAKMVTVNAAAASGAVVRAAAPAVVAPAGPTPSSAVAIDPRHVHGRGRVAFLHDRAAAAGGRLPLAAHALGRIAIAYASLESRPAAAAPPAGAKLHATTAAGLVRDDPPPVFSAMSSP
jgi:autotransporter passenger strand-loop-strand repeat protein